MVDTSMIRWEVKRRRGCGYRKRGGLYLVSGWPMHTCGLLPRELGVCPCCNAGVHQKIGWSWVQARMVLRPQDAQGCGAACDPVCGVRHLACEPERKIGLIWIGAQHYPEPEDFIREGREMGLSRRVAAAPKGFVIGETWVLLAHPKACLPRLDSECPTCTGDGQILNPVIQREHEAHRGVGTARPILVVTGESDAIARTLGIPERVPCPICSKPRPGIFGLFKPTAIERICVPSELEQEGFLEGLQRRGITPVLVPEDDPDHMPGRGREEPVEAATS